MIASKLKAWIGIAVPVLLMAALFAENESRAFPARPLFFTPEKLEVFLQTYSAQEKQLIMKDLQVVRSVCFDDKKPSGGMPFYLGTAGGPGSRKSTILERFIADHPEYQKGVYLDPSLRGLKFMPHTYHAQSLNARLIAENIQYLPTVRAAYEKWQDASLYITLALIEEAFSQGLSVVHGTSSTSSYVPDFFDKLHERGYEIKLLLCASPDQFRYDAVKYRNTEQRFYQSTPKEAFTKGKLFTEKMAVYFDKADELYLYWSSSLTEPEQLAMVLSKGKAQIFNQAALDKFVAKYNADRVALAAEDKQLSSWQHLLEGYQARFNHKKSSLSDK